MRNSLSSKHSFVVFATKPSLHFHRLIFVPDSPGVQDRLDKFLPILPTRSLLPVAPHPEGRGKTARSAPLGGWGDTLFCFIPRLRFAGFALDGIRAREGD